MLYVHDEETQSEQMNHLIEIMTDDMKFMLHRKMKEWMAKQIDAQDRIDKWAVSISDISNPDHTVTEGTGYNLLPNSLNQCTKKRKLCE